MGIHRMIAAAMSEPTMMATALWSGGWREETRTGNGILEEGGNLTPAATRSGQSYCLEKARRLIDDGGWHNRYRRR